jgi:hypothetical protein
MSYDKAATRHSFGIFDFGGAADQEFTILGPKGKAGILVNYGVEGVTEVFAGSSVTPKIAVGISGNPDAYGEELDLDGVALNSGKSVLSTAAVGTAAYDALMVDRNIDPDVVVFVTCTGATGSPTGMGVPFVDIIWQD